MMDSVASPPHAPPPPSRISRDGASAGRFIDKRNMIRFAIPGKLNLLLVTVQMSAALAILTLASHAYSRYWLIVLAIVFAFVMQMGFCLRTLLAAASCFIHSRRNDSQEQDSPAKSGRRCRSVSQVHTVPERGKAGPSAAGSSGYRSSLGDRISGSAFAVGIGCGLLCGIWLFLGESAIHLSRPNTATRGTRSARP
jgi:hypothetical protein